MFKYVAYNTGKYEKALDLASVSIDFNVKFRISFLSISLFFNYTSFCTFLSVRWNLLLLGYTNI